MTPTDCGLYGSRNARNVENRACWHFEMNVSLYLIQSDAVAAEKGIVRVYHPEIKPDYFMIRTDR
jgi:hypothetical protein